MLGHDWNICQTLGNRSGSCEKNTGMYIYLIFVCVPTSTLQTPHSIWCPPKISFNFYLLNKPNPTEVEIFWLDKEGRSTQEGATSLVILISKKMSPTGHLFCLVSLQGGYSWKQINSILKPWKFSRIFWKTITGLLVLIFVASDLLGANPCKSWDLSVFFAQRGLFLPKIW